MKIVYDKKYTTVYSPDPAAASGRIEGIYNVLCGHYEFLKPQAAYERDLKLAHWKDHIDYVKSDKTLYQVAKLAVGGAITAAELAMQGETAFGLIRPLGNHASKNSSWGLFNLLAISPAKSPFSCRFPTLGFGMSAYSRKHPCPS